jgi:hypothetical protein
MGLHARECACVVCVCACVCVCVCVCVYGCVAPMYGVWLHTLLPLFVCIRVSVFATAHPEQVARLDSIFAL